MGLQGSTPCSPLFTKEALSFTDGRGEQTSSGVLLQQAFLWWWWWCVCVGFGFGEFFGRALFEKSSVSAAKVAWFRGSSLETGVGGAPSSPL